MKKPKIIFNCHRCGKEIPTFWDEDGDLDGDFIGVESDFSEALDKFVTQTPQCMECTTTKKFKLHGAWKGPPK